MTKEYKKTIFFSHASVPNEDDGDCHAIFELDDSKKIIIVCDGVSASSSGKIASHLATACAKEYFLNNLEDVDKNAYESTQNLISELITRFTKFQNLSEKYTTPFGLNFLEESKDIANLSTDTTSTKDDLLNEMLMLFGDLNIEVAFLKKVLTQLPDTGREFCTTIGIAYIQKIADTTYKMYSFMLGDFYFLHTVIPHGTTNLDYKDILFDRGINSFPNQFSSVHNVVGNYDLKVSFIKSGSIITLGTDGSKLTKIPQLIGFNYEGRTKYHQYEKYIEYSEFLIETLDDFKNSAKRWHDFASSKKGISDDFTLINILLT